MTSELFKISMSLLEPRDQPSGTTAPSYEIFGQNISQSLDWDMFCVTQVQIGWIDFSTIYCEGKCGLLLSWGKNIKALRGVCVVLSAMTGGQYRGGAGAVWIRRCSASGSRPGLWGALEDRESGVASAAALCLPTLPRVKRRLPTSPQLIAAAPACLPTGDTAAFMIQ